MSAIKVSIVVAIYNVEAYLEKCLTTLLKQTYPNYELILVDDGSSDRCGEICQDFSQKNPAKIKYYHKENGGLSDARNYGLQYVTGDYVLFIDSDDYVEENMLERMVLMSADGQKKIVECNFLWEYPDKIRTDIRKSYCSLNDYLVNGRIVAWNKMYLTSWLKESQVLFPKGKLYEDQAFFFKLVTFLDSIDDVAIDEACEVHYVQRGNSISYSETKRIADIFWIYQEIIDFYQNKGCLKQYFAELEYRFSRNLLGNVLLRKVLKLKDKKLKQQLLTRIWQNVHSWFPDWRKNKYLKTKDKQNIYLRLLNKVSYKLFYLL